MGPIKGCGMDAEREWVQHTAVVANNDGSEKRVRRKGNRIDITHV